MFENIGNFFKKMMKSEQKELLVDTNPTSKDAAKERLHIVLMQDRANVSADFLELMKQEIIDVIKKYIVIDEDQIDVRLTNQENEDGTTGAPSLYANIPILNIRNDIKGEVLNQNAKINNPKNAENLDDMSKENDLNFSDRTVIMPVLDEEKDIDKTLEEDKTKILFSENREEAQNEEIKSENIEEAEEKPNLVTSDENITEDEEDDDDDVTFDDLLKAAEEEERKVAEEKEKKESEEKKKSASKTTTIKKQSTKGKKKSSSKSTSKKKK